MKFQRDWNRIHAAEIKFLRSIKVCSRLDKIRNEVVREELVTSLRRGFFGQYRDRCQLISVKNLSSY